MASPHVAGVMALFAATGDYTPAQLKSFILDRATSGVVTDAGVGSPNLMLYNNAGSGSTCFRSVGQETSKAFFAKMQNKFLLQQ